YVEQGVGDAVASVLAGGQGLGRADLFLQTKFTHPGGQDHRMPYDPKDPPEVQVRRSFASSLEHLGTTYLDSYVLHGPSQRFGLAPEAVDTWRAVERPLLCS